jgi:hypothetical protein
MKALARQLYTSWRENKSVIVKTKNHQAFLLLKFTEVP